MKNPEKLFEKIEKDFKQLFGLNLPQSARRIYFHVADLYNEKCTTKYHNLEHTLEVVEVCNDILKSLNNEIMINSVLRHGYDTVFVSALMHDIGYLENLFEDDNPSTKGAEYINEHEERSKRFAREYIAQTIRREFLYIDDMLAFLDIKEIEDVIEDTKLKNYDNKNYGDGLGKILRSADLIAPLSNNYIKKLDGLYEEFQQNGFAKKNRISSMKDLYRGALKFWEKIRPQHMDYYLEFLERNGYDYKKRVEETMKRLRELAE